MSISRRTFLECAAAGAAAAWKERRALAGVTGPGNSSISSMERVVASQIAIPRAEEMPNGCVLALAD
jgi:hypothetical protein